MSSNECWMNQLNDYYSFSLSLISFLQKAFIQLEKALLQYSLRLKRLEKKSRKIFSQTTTFNPMRESLFQSFHLFCQMIEEEYHQCDQRAKFIHWIGSTVKTLDQQIHSSDLRKERDLVQKYASRSDYRGKHHRMILIWKDHLDLIASQTNTLLWKLFSQSPMKQICSSIEIGSGDHTFSPTSNNACIQSSSTSSKIDETRIESNEQDPDHQIDEEDEDQWLNLVEQNAPHVEDRSLHLSDLSYTTDCSSLSE